MSPKLVDTIPYRRYLLSGNIRATIVVHEVSGWEIVVVNPKIMSKFMSEPFDADSLIGNDDPITVTTRPITWGRATCIVRGGGFLGPVDMDVLSVVLGNASYIIKGFARRGPRIAQVNNKHICVLDNFLTILKVRIINDLNIYVLLIEKAVEPVQ